MSSNYRPGGFVYRRLMHPTMNFLLRRGIGPPGAVVLVVRGRSSGLPRECTVNLLQVESGQYLVAPRGDTHWVRNLRAAGEGELRKGKMQRRVRATELGDELKPPLLREYIRRWGPYVRTQFTITAESPDEELSRNAPMHPVFRIEDAAA